MYTKSSPLILIFETTTCKPRYHDVQIHPCYAHWFFTGTTTQVESPDKVQ